MPKKKDDKPVALTDLKELQTFFAANARAVKKAADADDVVKAWLRAAAELNQDGFYKFTVTAEPATAAGESVTATGTAAVAPQGGNKGAITATLAFTGGKLATAETKVDLKPGIRPICQATKLLDADPIVRGMAEQSIRVMGSAAKPYLDEQRAKASRSCARPSTVCGNRSSPKAADARRAARWLLDCRRIARSLRT